jgi:anti-sigma factor RsiW
MTETALDIDDEILAKVSDYLDGALAAPERAEVARHIAEDDAWRRAHDEIAQTRNALSGMRKAHAPATFAQDVTSTIHKRSAGRFFGKRTLGDRVPFTALLVVALLGLVVIGFLMWSSQTGSLRVDHPATAPHAGSALLSPP